MKNQMSNFHLRIVANTIHHFKLAMEIAFFIEQELFVSKKHYESARSWKVDDGWLVLSRLGADDALIESALTLLPIPLDHEQAVNFAYGWFMSAEAKAIRGPEPAIDDETKGAFIVQASNSYGDRRHEIVRIKPTWTISVQS
jgi:hypothetical protein